MAAAVRYADSRKGTISFAVVDEAGRLHGHRARAVAPSASVLKAMLLAAYLRRFDVRDRPLARWERDLLGPMIRRSDNAAATRMVGLVGERRLRHLAVAAGMEHFRLHWPIWGESEITPRGQALYFDRIARLVPARHRAYALRLLASVVPSQRWGVGRVAHPGWRLYFKGGWGSGTGLVDHQVALYAAAGERFSVAIFTRFNPDHEYGKESLRGLAVRLTRGLARPGARLPLVARFASGGGYAVTASPGCRSISIRPRTSTPRRFPTGARSCNGFHLAAAGGRALWSWQDDVGHLATAGYDDEQEDDLGDFDSEDELGELAGRGAILAYQHGGEVAILGGPDCPAPENAVLAAGGGRIAVAAGGIAKVVDPVDCAVVCSLRLRGAVQALALTDDLLVSLARGASGRLWLVRHRISTGERLGRTEVPRGTLPALAVRGSWAAFRTRHRVHVLDTASGRAWNVWRPRRVPVGMGIVGRRVVWAENHGGGARRWALRLPARA